MEKLQPDTSLHIVNDQEYIGQEEDRLDHDQKHAHIPPLSGIVGFRQAKPQNCDELNHEFVEKLQPLVVSPYVPLFVSYKNGY